MTKIFKFGGASIRDAAAIRNVATILDQYRNEKLVIVVSALGKTTNALEEITNAYFYGKGDAHALLQKLRDQHQQILQGLFTEPGHPVFDDINNTFVEIEWILEDEPHDKYDYIYDQIVSIGEMVATKMVSHYLNYKNIPAKWLDVRDYIRTDNTYREGKVNWELTEKNIREKIPPLLETQFVLTQGFLGGTSENYTTTLGREGSDYTAAIFGYSLDAEEVTIWKDVPGVLNADPRYFPEAEKIDTLSYHEAIEMTYYGATVIHPKTIKPLQNKKIGLHVRSFIDFKKEGTRIGETVGEQLSPVLVLKRDQVLISMAAKDFSFIAEENLSFIFSAFSRYRVKVNMMQNAAISFSVCADDNEKIEPMLEELSESFNLKTNDHLDLLTIRHYSDEVADKYAAGKDILLEQKSRLTMQLVMRSGEYKRE